MCPAQTRSQTNISCLVQRWVSAGTEQLPLGDAVPGSSSLWASNEAPSNASKTRKKARRVDPFFGQLNEHTPRPPMSVSEMPAKDQSQRRHRVASPNSIAATYRCPCDLVHTLKSEAGEQDSQCGDHFCHT